MSDQRTMFESIYTLNNTAHKTWREAIYAKSPQEQISLLRFIVDASDYLVCCTHNEVQTAEVNDFQLVPFGYIATFETGRSYIEGTGYTEKEAIEDAYYMTSREDVKVVTLPATEELITAANRRVGILCWEVVDGVACTMDEADAMRLKRKE